ncbi:MAG: terpene cyclase/mutase family protein [Planctomycetes bacterium]|nr:terpene cyclase/mutase family protein [Planctomycetota bacterium]
MKCPQCNKETPLSASRCVHCGLSLTFTAGAGGEPPARRDGPVETEWGLRLLRYAALLALAAGALWWWGRSLAPLPEARVPAEEPQMSVPEAQVAFPRPALPPAPPAPKLLEPEAVALPEAAPLPRAHAAFGSRDPRVRKLFLERNGGDANTEAAVALGLDWLKRTQDDDGSWDYAKYGVAEAHREEQAHRVGVAGLALLAFLGAGHNPRDPGPFRDTVAKAIKFLLAAQDPDGRFPGSLYAQGICTMALVEAYGLTDETEFLLPAQKGVDFIVRAQGASGGWDYQPGGARGDTSVTGWQIMALKSAKRAGIQFPNEVYDKALAFLRQVTHEDGAVGYDTGANWRTTPALTAAGANALLFMEVGPADARVQKALAIMLAALPRAPRWHGNAWNPRADIYFWYHGSLALSRLGGPEWAVWNARVKEILLALQDRQGDLKGSWRLAGDPWGDYAGRIYFTALAIMSLQVYYRYD